MASSSERVMTASEFMKVTRKELDSQSATENSDVECEPAYSDSFIHYLFLKTDFSLSRISRKIVQQLNNINLNDDDQDLKEEFHAHRLNKRVSNENLHQLKHKGGYGSTERKRSISESALTGTATRLPTHPSQRMLKEVDRGRSRHEFTDWLEEQRQKNLKCNKTTKIIRIDINEIDQVASSEIHGVHYLDDLFKESNINKFYTFDNKNLSTQSFFLATNIALSTGSLNSEMSEDTYRRAQEEHFKKKKRREKKRKSIKRTSIKKKHHQAADGKSRSYSESHNLKKKKKGFIRTATMNLIGRNKGRKDSDTSIRSLETEYTADLRSYHAKRFEICDDELDHFLGSGRMNKRRNAIVHKIDTMYRDSELHTFMENLLRSEYIETFLL